MPGLEPVASYTGHAGESFYGRFAPGLPATSDGQKLFLLHLAHKMRAPEDGGATRITGVLIDITQTKLAEEEGDELFDDEEEEDEEEEEAEPEPDDFDLPDIDESDFEDYDEDEEEEKEDDEEDDDL